MGLKVLKKTEYITECLLEFGWVCELILQDIFIL